MLSVSGLTKKFEGLTVMEGFDLTVRRGGFTTLIGPSGCGKSTLFDVLTGVFPGDSGRISWLGEDVPDLMGRAAYMQQKDLLLPWLSMIDNAILPATIAGADESNSQEKVSALFNRLGLHDFENYIPRKVSGGMRQRCALVRTLMFEHELVLLDEPLSSLDAISRRSLQTLLLLFQSEFNKTILMITHDIEEALLMSDELLVLTPMPMQIRERFVLEMPKPGRNSNPELLKIKEHVLEELEGDLNGTI
ncbi:MAG: ABC transporter ATP-binding protein [Thermodesulfobacteriota bacterium]|nr:ABC transporter ATP-binding protein [Thermodesulfobacteriota bacterium]